MREKLEIAKKWLEGRWIEAFEEFNYLKAVETHVSWFKFSTSQAYSLTGYENGKIDAGVRLLNKPPDKKSYYYKYGFDSKKEVVSAQQFDGLGNMLSSGYFNFQDDFIEYIEFNLAFQMPCKIQRVNLSDNKKDIFQSARLNGGGGYPVFEGMGKEQRIKFILENDSMDFDIKEYVVEDNRIVRSYSYFKCGMESLSEDVYKYDVSGELLQIKSHFDTGSSAVIYSKPSGKSLKDVSNELAEKFSVYLATVLSKYKFDSPLFCVELGYQYCYSYWPHLSIITGNQKEQALLCKSELLFLSADFLEHDEARATTQDDLQNCFSEFESLVEDKKNWEEGRRMLRQTAKIMTERKLNGLVPVSDDFIVFPIEWAMTEDVKQILLKCGATNENVKRWKKLGWF